MPDELELTIHGYPTFVRAHFHLLFGQKVEVYVEVVALRVSIVRLAILTGAGHISSGLPQAVIHDGDEALA